MNLIVECHAFDSDGSGHQATKRHYLANYWLPAANALRTYGEWRLLEVRDIEQLEEMIKKTIVQ